MRRDCLEFVPIQPGPDLAAYELQQAPGKEKAKTFKGEAAKTIKY
jgi:hypothetical protein